MGKKKQKNYYLGDKCIGGGLENNDVIYQSNFANSEPDKMQAVNDLLEKVSDKELNEYSFKSSLCAKFSFPSTFVFKSTF